MGQSHDEIAAELFVSVSTIQTQPGGVQRRLTTRNRVEIAAWAWEPGIVR